MKRKIKREYQKVKREEMMGQVKSSAVYSLAEKIDVKLSLLLTP